MPFDPAILFLGIYLKEVLCVYKDTHTLMFAIVSGSFKKEEQTKLPS